MLRNVLWLAEADLRVEGRHRVTWVGAAGFGVVLVLLFSLSISTGPLRRPEVVATLLWLALTLASLLLAGRSSEVDVEEGALDSLLLSGVPGEALYLAKVISAGAQLTALFVLFLLGSLILDDMAVRGSLALLVACAGLSCLVLAAAGSLLGGLVSSGRGRQAVLPLLLFPAILPTLLAAVRLTTEAISPGLLDPGEVGRWLTVLVVAAVVWLVAGALLYLPAVEP